jgi:integrase
LERWLDQKDDLLAGRTPRTKSEGPTVAELGNHFLTSKKRLLDGGEIVQRTFRHQHEACRRIVECFGKDRPVDDLRPDDFARLRGRLAATLGPLALTVALQGLRSIFNYAYEARLIPTPIVFGPDFRGPGAKVIRRKRHAKGKRMFEADELRTILASVTVPLRAMTLLAVNAGLGNHDVGAMPVSVVDLESGWLDYPREKTGTQRRCPLWPETRAAISVAMKERPEPTDPADADLVFITSRGNPWVRTTATGASVDSVSFEFSKWLGKLGIKRPGLAFYALRHTFRTVADEMRDQPAIDFIMGHADNSMASVCRERISDARLRAVVDHVHAWLFANEKAQ